MLRVADSLQEIFSQASAVRFAILSTETAKRWVLFSPTRFWTQERVNALDKLVGQRHSSIIEDNCRTFLEKLTDKRMESNIWGFNLEDARILLENDKLIEALWRGASRTPVNFRFLKSFRKLKASIDQVRQTPLDAPSWLASAQADASPTTGTGAKPPPPSFPTILIQPESYCAEHASDTLNATCTLASPNLPVAAKRPDLT